MTNSCRNCTREVGDDAFVCRHCTRTLDIALGNIGGLWPELDTLHSRQGRTGVPTRSSSGVYSGMDLRFASDGAGTQLENDVRNTLSTWIRICTDTWPDLAQPRDLVPAMATWLAKIRTAIAGQEWSAELLRDVTRVERRLTRFVDRPPSSWYAGICGSITPYDDGSEVLCERALYAEPGDPFVRCRDCGCTYDVKARRTALLTEAEDRVATVRVIARIVTTLGATGASEALIENRISKWVERNKLTSAGTRVVDGKARSVYRIGDVLDLLASDSRGKSA